MIDQTLQLEKHTIHLVPDSLVEETFTTGWKGFPVGATKHFRPFIEKLRRYNAPFMIGLINPERKVSELPSLPSGWFPIIIMWKDGIFFPVSIERRTCKGCQNLLHIATFANGSLYLGSENAFEIIDSLLAIVPETKCPICGHNVEIGTVWAIPSDTTLDPS